MKKMEEYHDRESMLKNWTSKGADRKMVGNPPEKRIKNRKVHGKRPLKPMKGKRRERKQNWRNY